MSDLVIASNRGLFSFSEEFIQEAVESVEKGELPEPQDFGAGGLVGGAVAHFRADPGTFYGFDKLISRRS